MLNRHKEATAKVSESQYIEKNDPWSSHSIILNWLDRCQSGTIILDIGTATGLFGKRLTGRGYVFKGIEPIHEWADLASPYYSEFCRSGLEEAPDRFLSNADVVICADVLEHLACPTKELNRLVALQKPETQILISIPNVANLWVRLGLLFGRFNYSEYGILDRNHLRFFTLSTFLDLLSQSGLRPVELNYTPIPLNRVHPFFWKNKTGRCIHHALYNLTQVFPRLLAYQFVTRTEILSQVKGKDDGREKSSNCSSSI